MKLFTLLVLTLGFSLSYAADTVTRGYCMPNLNSTNVIGSILEVCTATYANNYRGAEYYLLTLSTRTGPQTFVGSAHSFNGSNCEFTICKGKLYIMGRLKADNTIENPSPIAMNLYMEKSKTRYTGLQIKLRGDLGLTNNYYSSGNHKFSP